MPKYVYQCTDCKKRFEITKPMQAPHPETCEECGGRLFQDFRSIHIIIPGSFRSDGHVRHMMDAGLEVDEYDQAFGIRSDETGVVRDPTY